MMSQEIKSSLTEHTPLWGGPMEHTPLWGGPMEHTPLWGVPMRSLELNHPWIDPGEGYLGVQCIPKLNQFY